MSKLDNRKTEYISKIEKIKNPLDLDNIKTEIFGKNGFLTLEFKKLGNLPAEEKKAIALQLNKAKEDLTNFINKKTLDLSNKEIDQKLKNEKIDITLPGRTYFTGKIHPV